jgi:PAS domain S-box-containing protein
MSECPFGELLKGKAAISGQYVTDEVYWRKDGTSFAVEYTGAPIIERGAIIGAVNVFRDIGGRKQAEAAMARTLATTQALGKCLRLSLEDLSLDQMLDAALTELLLLPWLNLQNRGSIFVVDRGRLRMAAQRNLPPQIVANCARIEIGQCLCGMAAARAAVVFADCVDDRHEYRFDGMAEHGHYCVPIIGGGEVMGVINTYIGHGHRRDADEETFLHMFAHTLAGIIKRKRAEENLKASENLAKTLMNAPVDAAFLLDTDGIILAANQAFVTRFGATGDALVGKPFFALLPPDLAIARRVQFDRILASKTPLHTHDERDGLALDNRIYPVVAADGTVTQVAVFSRDVTEQRRANQAMEKALADLERSNQDLEQFAYVASHDLRQPLRMISGYLGLIERRLGNELSADMKDFIGFAVGGAKRMDALILGLLEYSRIGRAENPFEPVSLGEVLNDALLNLETAIQEAGAGIGVPDTAATVPGDRSELTRLFQNLIGNAVKYRSPDRPCRVAVGWERDGESWRISVADNGTGIAAADHDRAFGIFKRLVADDKVEGTGIGLAICKKIVEHHGGRIWIESQVNVGTTFLFTLQA